MELHLEVLPYRRRFRRPLRTSRGLWSVREGAIVSLTAPDGRIGRGEIAPLPEFGSETLAAALAYCQGLGSTIARSEIFTIPDCFPACQFALESALMELTEAPHDSAFAPHDFCYLLPAGPAAIVAWEAGWQVGARTFKWKIGVGDLADELQILKQLLAALPPEARLRVDANGGLDTRAAQAWLTAADRAAGRIEYCEQLLPVDCFDTLQCLARDYQTPLALDEAVATLPQLAACQNRGWTGIYVVKAAIAGSPQRLRRLCRARPIAAVFSSVFEGEIGRRAALRLAGELNASGYALGFGTTHWLEPDSPPSHA